MFKMQIFIVLTWITISKIKHFEKLICMKLTIRGDFLWIFYHKYQVHSGNVNIFKAFYPIALCNFYEKFLIFEK